MRIEIYLALETNSIVVLKAISVYVQKFAILTIRIFTFFTLNSIRLVECFLGVFEALSVTIPVAVCVFIRNTLSLKSIKVFCHLTTSSISVIVFITRLVWITAFLQIWAAQIITVGYGTSLFALLESISLQKHTRHSIPEFTLITAVSKTQILTYWTIHTFEITFALTDIDLPTKSLGFNVRNTTISIIIELVFSTTNLWTVVRF